MNIHDQPLADKGFISYRYRAKYGFIIIGAKDTVDALSEARRYARTGPIVLENLEVWNGAAYVPATLGNGKDFSCK